MGKCKKYSKDSFRCVSVLTDIGKRCIVEDKMKRFKAIDLFSGCGGLSCE